MNIICHCSTFFVCPRLSFAFASASLDPFCHLDSEHCQHRFHIIRKCAITRQFFFCIVGGSFSIPRRYDDYGRHTCNHQNRFIRDTLHYDNTRSHIFVDKMNFGSTSWGNVAAWNEWQWCFECLQWLRNQFTIQCLERFLPPPCPPLKWFQYLWKARFFGCLEQHGTTNEKSIVMSWL